MIDIVLIRLSVLWETVQVFSMKRMAAFQMCCNAVLMCSGDEQPLPAVQQHSNGCCAEPGRGHGALHHWGEWQVPVYYHAAGRTLCFISYSLSVIGVLQHQDHIVFCPAGGFCLHRLAKFPWEDRGLPGSEPFLGRQQGAVGLHLQVDQRLFNGADRGCFLPQVGHWHETELENGQLY